MASPARGLVAFAVAAGICGCYRPTLPPPSGFYSGVNLKAVVDESAPQGVKWGSFGSGSGGGGGTTARHHTKDFDGDLQCDPAEVAPFLQSIQAKLKKGLESTGARPTGSPATEKPDPNGFRFDYEAGESRGSVRAAVRSNTDASKDEYPLNLSIEVEELAGAVPDQR